MADYITGLPIDELEYTTELEDDNVFIVEDSEATKQITFESLKNNLNNIVSLEYYFAVSDSPSFCPSHNSQTNAIVGEAILDSAIVGDSGQWLEEMPDIGEDEYVWISGLITFSNGETQWTDPYCLTDKNVKSQIADIKESTGKTESDINDIESIILENEEAINKLASEIENTQSSIEQLTKDIENIYTSLSSLNDSIQQMNKQIGEQDISDIGDGTITGAIASSRYAIVGPDSLAASSAEIEQQQQEEEQEKLDSDNDRSSRKRFTI